MYKYVYIYMCVDMYTYIHIHTYIRKYMCIYIYAYKYVYFDIWIRICIDIYMYIRIYISGQCVTGQDSRRHASTRDQFLSFMYSYIYTYIYLHIHKYIYIHIRIGGQRISGQDTRRHGSTQDKRLFITRRWGFGTHDSSVRPLFHTNHIPTIRPLPAHTTQECWGRGGVQSVSREYRTSRFMLANSSATPRISLSGVARRASRSVTARFGGSLGGDGRTRAPRTARWAARDVTNVVSSPHTSTCPGLPQRVAFLEKYTGLQLRFKDLAQRTFALRT